MKIGTIFTLLCTFAFLGSITATANAAPAARQSNEVYWMWGDPAGSSRLVRTQSGISGNINASVANEVASAKGLAVTLWLVIFNEPGECAPAGCGLPDLFNPDVKPDVLYGGGNLVGASEKINIGFHQSEGDNSGSIAGLFGMPTDGGEPFGLIDALTAEVHYVLRFHGPMYPEAMPAQINSYGGGCIAFAPFGYPEPTHPLDLYLGLGDCQDVMFSVHQP